MSNKQVLLVSLITYNFSELIYNKNNYFLTDKKN